MLNFDTPARWLRHADHDGGRLGRTFRRLRKPRPSEARAIADERDKSILAPLALIGLLTLFMLWAVINPM